MLIAFVALVTGFAVEFPELFAEIQRHPGLRHDVLALCVEILVGIVYKAGVLVDNLLSLQVEEAGVPIVEGGRGERWGLN